ARGGSNGRRSVWFLDLEGFRLLRRMRMRSACVDLELPQHGVAERAFRQHAFHRLLQHALRLGRMQLRETGLPDAAGVFGMAVVGLPLGLLAGDAQLCDVDDDDIVAGVYVRRVLRLMLA